jgi:5-formyltetrahydrofolate cyclo-ligase
MDARHVAGYWPADGEIDVLPALTEAHRRGALTYLPRVPGPDLPLRFRVWRPGVPLRRNRFGIPEPATGPGLARACRLDAVLVPLVGFDRRGNRLGMGGGFYDRTFAGRHRTLLIGVAFDCQRVLRVPTHWWDVPLAAVVTERGIVRRPRGRGKQQDPDPRGAGAGSVGMP